MTTLTATPEMTKAADRLAAEATECLAAETAAKIAVGLHSARQATRLAIQLGVARIDASQRLQIITYGDDLYIRNECLVYEIDEAFRAEELDLLAWRDLGVLLIDEEDERKLFPRVLRHYAELSPLAWMGGKCASMAKRIEAGKSAHAPEPALVVQPMRNDNVVAPQFGMKKIRRVKQAQAA